MNRDVCDLSSSFSPSDFSLLSEVLFSNFSDNFLFTRSFLLFIFLHFFIRFRICFSSFRDFLSCNFETDFFVVLVLNPPKPLSDIFGEVTGFLVLAFLTLIFLDLNSFTSGRRIVHSMLQGHRLSHRFGT